MSAHNHISATLKLTALAAFLVTAAGLTSSPARAGVAAQPAPVPPTTNLPRPDHVVIVLEENKDYSTIIGSPTAPFINRLAQEGALFTDSHGLEHPSQPNYLQLFAGSTFGVKTDNTPREIISAPSLCGTLSAAKLSFCGYAESLPTVGDLCSKEGRYARKHCPWTDFSDVPAAANVPFDGNFPATADGFAKLPTFSFVVPNLDNDMHDGSVARGDAWLAGKLGAYADWARTHNSLLIITFDEDEGTVPNHIPTIFVGQMVKPGIYDSRITHLNVLRTIEDMYGLPALADSAGASAITDVWTSPARIPPVVASAASTTNS